MSKHDNIYNILGKLASLEPKPEPAKKPLTESKAATVSEAMIAEKYSSFKEAKKVSEAKPDYIDLDKDGNKKEPMKKAAKDAKKKDVDEGVLDMVKKGGQMVGKAVGDVAKSAKTFMHKSAQAAVDEYMQTKYPGKTAETPQKKDAALGLYMIDKGILSREELDQLKPMVAKSGGLFQTCVDLKCDFNLGSVNNPGKMLKDILYPKGMTKKDAAGNVTSFRMPTTNENFEDQDDIENKGEYDQEGDMAKDDLSTIEDAARELDSILQSDDNLPEWVQSKINKAMDYLDTARDYMKANQDDDNPEVNEEMKSWMRDPKDPESKIPAFQRKNKDAGKQAGEKAVDDMNKKAGAKVFKSGRANEGQVIHTKTGLIHKGTYGSDYQGSDDDDDDYGTKKTSASGEKKRGRPRIHPAKDPNAPKRPRGRPRKNMESINLDTFVEDAMAELEGIYLGEKAVSKQQQKFMGMVHAMQKGEKVKGASPELKKAAKSMSKKDAKDFAKTKHKGLPQKVSEGINFVEMMRETDQTVEEMLAELHAELDEYKRSGHMGDKLRDAMELHRHNKNKLMGEMNSLALPEVAPIESDTALDELAALAGLGQPVVEEPNEGNEFSGARADAIRAGKDTFNVAGKTYKVTDAGDEQMNEGQCNMSEAGEMCPVHGLKECGMYEASKPDYIDLDKDGDKKEPMKKAAKDKEEDLDEAGHFIKGIKRFIKGKGHPMDVRDKHMGKAAFTDDPAVQDKEFKRYDKVQGVLDRAALDEDEVNECGMGPMAPQEPESRLNVSTNISSDGKKDVTVNASGDEAEKLMQLLKLAGLGSSREPQMTRPDDMDEEFANEPKEKYAGTDAIIRQGNDLNRPKAQYADKPKAGDNPMATESQLKLEGRLAAEYELLKKGK